MTTKNQPSKPEPTLEQSRKETAEAARNSFLGKLSPQSLELGAEIVRLETVNITAAQLDQVELIGALTGREDIGDAPGGWLAACALLLRWERGRVSMYHTVYESVLEPLGRKAVERQMIPRDDGSPASVQSFKALYRAARYARAMTARQFVPEVAAKAALELVGGLSSEDAPQVVGSALAKLDAGQVDAPTIKAERLVSFRGRYTVNTRELFEQAVDRVRIIRKLSPEQAIERVSKLLLDGSDAMINTLFDALEQYDPEQDKAGKE